MPVFQYDAKLLEIFPRVHGGVIFGAGLQNSPSSDALKAVFEAEQKATIERIGDTPLSEIQSIADWRAAFSLFGVQPTKYRNAAEALLRRLTKKGDIPSINTLVDIGNLVSIRYGLPVAVFDTQSLTGALTVRFADGTEHYTELGSTEIKHPEEDEVIFADDTGLVFARRWCWKQSFQSASKINTSDVIITVEAQHVGGNQDVTNAVQDLLALLNEYADGTYQHSVCSVDMPRFGA